MTLTGSSSVLSLALPALLLPESVLPRLRGASSSSSAKLGESPLENVPKSSPDRDRSRLTTAFS